MASPLRRVVTRLALALLVLVGVGQGTALADAGPALLRHGGAVTDGSVRAEILTPTLVRLEYAADRRFEDRPTFNAVARNLTPPPFTARRKHGELEIRTSRLTLRYREGSGAITAANTTVELTVAGRGTAVHPAFGAPAHPDALGGWYRGLDYYPGQAGPVDQIKLHQGLLDRSGWYLLDDTTTALRTTTGWVQPRPAHQGAYQDGYFFGYGHDYKQGLADLATLTGPSDLLPKWAFGNWFSEYHAFSFDDYKNSLLPAFRRNKVPLDVLVADTDWKSPNSWAGWNWNPSLFPDPKAYLDWANGQHLHPTLNIHAAISEDDPRYAQAQQIAHGGLAPAKQSFAPKAHRFDWSDPAQNAAWQWLHASFEKQGVRQWWLDYCCDDSTASMPGLTPDSWVNELYRRGGDARGLRGFSLARIGASYPDYNGTPAAGPWGEHRSTVQFTGDTKADWETLAFEAAFTPAEGSIGLPYVSHDIGSFAGKHLPDDLYLRWIQLGAFQPVNRLHSDHGDRLPWQYGTQVSGAAKSFLRLREALVPYLYATARQAHDTGLPMTRALYLDHPEDAAAYTHNAEYMLGDQLLVAPVTTPGLTALTKVWFPAGTWTDIFTGATYHGPGEQTIASTPDRMPVFARAGGILPLAPYADSTETTPAGALTLKVFPHGDGGTQLYDDAGEGLAYQKGRYATTPVRYTEHGQAVLTIGPASGHYTGQPSTRTYTVKFVDVTRPAHVAVNGRPASSSYDSTSHTLTVKAPAVATGRGVVVSHDGRALAKAPDPAVGFTLEAPNGLTAGSPGDVVATVTNHGPGSIGGVAVKLAQPSGWTIEPKSPTTTASLAAGGTFRATYTVTPPGTASNAQLTGTVAYRNPDGSAATLPASLSVKPRPVAVTFRVRAPAGTPADATLYVPGNIDQLGPWDPGKLKMTNKGGGIWEATITVPDGTEFQYKYTRGDWNTVEWWGSITGTNNRDVTVNGAATGTMVVDDTSTAWDDTSVPDTHKAPQFWRDPLVVSTSPADGDTVSAPAAVTVRFNRDIAPAGNGYDGSVAVTRGGAAVAGTAARTSAGELTWTPSAALPAGTYQVSVANVQSALGSDGVPMRRPYTFSFTVG
ncbi:MAG: TIM-barrel domain-containing protein [Actinoallomurus sp.]